MPPIIRKTRAELQTEETPKEFWCFHCGKMVLPRVISLRRIKWAVSTSTKTRRKIPTLLVA